MHPHPHIHTAYLSDCLALLTEWPFTALQYHYLSRMSLLVPVGGGGGGLLLFLSLIGRALIDIIIIWMIWAILFCSLSLLVVRGVIHSFIVAV